MSRANDEPRARSWALMQRLVDGENRRSELADALGFRLGGGRGKALLALRGGPRTLSELAVHLGTDAPYATLVVDKLEAHGLVERRPHPHDRRRKLVSLTPEGESAVATVDEIWLRPPEAMAGLSAQDADRLTRILEKLVGREAED